MTLSVLDDDVSHVESNSTFNKKSTFLRFKIDSKKPKYLAFQRCIQYRYNHRHNRRRCHCHQYLNNKTICNFHNNKTIFNFRKMVTDHFY